MLLFRSNLAVKCHSGFSGKNLTIKISGFALLVMLVSDERGPHPGFLATLLL